MQRFQFNLFGSGSPRSVWHGDIEFLELNPNCTEIEVQGVNSKWYTVNLQEGTCSCSTTNRPCSHIERAEDMLQKGGKRSKSEAISAFHKSIRRSDVEAALYWAWWLAEKIRSPTYIRNYCRGIVLEETRNLHLLQEFTDGTAGKSWATWVHKLATSKKLYGVQCRNGLNEADIRARMKANEYGTTAPTLYELNTAVKTGDVIDRMTMFFRILQLEKPKRAEYKEALINALSEVLKRSSLQKDNIELLVRLMPKQEYAPLFAIEALNGFWSEECNQLCDWEPKTIDVSKIKKFPDCAQDFHTSKGRALLKKYWNEISPGQPLPDILDIRFAGGLLGLAWRMLANEQFNQELTEIPFEKVQWPQWIWDETRTGSAEYLFAPRPWWRTRLKKK